MRLIDADRLLDPKMRRMRYYLPNGDIAMPIGEIEHAPTVDAAPVAHGRWIYPKEELTISGKCSCCGWEAHYYEDDVVDMPYCPNCGAHMDLEKQDEE